NTTYTFNLGESVKDLTEGNIAAGLAYVVSTGDALDSAVVMGAVTNAFTSANEKEMIVGLYAAGDTAAFRTGRPAYMTRTDATGRFTIANLPHGRYSAFALRDKNANYKYDLPNEEIAFLDSMITLASTDTSTTFITMRSFLPASARQQVRSYSVSADGALELVFARAAESVGVRDVARTGGSLTWTPEYAPTRDTVLLWPSDTTLLGQGSYEIRVGQHVLDTLRYRPTRKMPFNTTLTAKLAERSGGASILLRSSRPLTAVDTTRIILRSDSVDVPFRATRSDDRNIALDFTARDGMPLQLLVHPKAVRDSYGGFNDTLRASFGTAAERSTGTLQVSVTGLDLACNYLLQALDGQQRVQMEAPLSADHPVVQWKLLAPGMRMLRLVHDANGNGRWDTGEWATLQQPERTWQHVEPVNVRAAWDVKVDWSIAKP
ncbi:MAG: hypothetical protein KF797_13505, partial [Flavobacteriales bacterium]|nr:hypothetical protein [Flavobacteriales bacterium]